MWRDPIHCDTPVERLPFRVEIASEAELMAVARLRAAAYGRHLPALATKLLQPEPADFEFGNEVFIAKSKLDGSLLGTLRTHANVLKPLPLEASMTLPDRFRGRLMIEATRLSVRGDLNASIVRNALFKAFFQYCLAQKADWMMAAGRRPVDRLYDGLMFEDVEQAGTFYPMAHAAGVPHRVMCLDPIAAEGLWQAAQHSLFSFVVQTQHPDIEIAGARDLSVPRFGIDTSAGIARAIDHALDAWPNKTPGRRIQCSKLTAQSVPPSANIGIPLSL